MKSKDQDPVTLKKFYLSPLSYLDYKEYIQDLYDLVKAQVPSYTYIRFSADLGFSATGVIHQIIKGRRTFSTKAAQKFISTLQLKNFDRQYLLLLVRYCNAKDPNEKTESLKKLIEIRAKSDPSQLNHDQLEFVSEWYHPVIKELISLPGLSQDPNVIAKMLKPSLRPKQVKGSFDLLERLGFIRYSKEQNRYEAMDHDLKTPRSVSGLLAARYHQACIDLAKSAVSDVEKEKRDISSITMKVSEPLIQKIKEQIYQFQMNMLGQEEASDNTAAIYQINVQFFPLTEFDLLSKGQDT